MLERNVVLYCKIKIAEHTWFWKTSAARLCIQQNVTEQEWEEFCFLHEADIFWGLSGAQ